MVVTTAQTIVLVCATLGGLALVGYPIKRLFERVRSPICIPSMVAGLAVLQVVLWYWLESGRQGLNIPVWTVLGLAAVYALVDVMRRRASVLRFDRCNVLRAVVAMSIGFLVVAINWSTVLSLPLLTTATTGNNDAVSYAISSENLVHGGFGDDGPAVGYQLGQTARIDAFGSMALIGSVSAVSHLGSWRVTTTTLFALTVLFTYCLALFVDALLGGDRWLLSSIVAGAASCTLLFVYVQVLFYVGQIMAMAVVPLLAVAAFRIRDARRPREFLGPMVSAVVVGLVMLSHYAHMFVLGAPLFVLPVILDRPGGERWRATIHRASRSAILMFVAAGVALLLVPVWFSTARDLLERQSNVVAGFPLPGFTPTELLGFLRMVTPKPSTARLLWSAVSVAIVAVVAIAARRPNRRLVRYFTIFSALVLGSYAVVYRRENGPSYRQWKWITFFQPTLAALVITMGALAIERALSNGDRRRRGAAVLTAAVFGVAVSTFTGSGVGTALRDRRQFRYATPEQFALSTDPVLKGLTSVNVDLDPFWDSMWAVYFLHDKTLYLQSPTYYRIAQPRADWTLVPAVGTMRGPSVHDINARFRLLHYDPSGVASTDAGALDGTVSVSLDADATDAGALTGVVEVTNTGLARWLGKDATAGDVKVGVHLEDESGVMLDYEWARIPLMPDRTWDIPPGSTSDQRFALPPLPPGRYVMQFELVSEQVAWFGTPTVASVVVP